MTVGSFYLIGLLIQSTENVAVVVKTIKDGMVVILGRLDMEVDHKMVKAEKKKEVKEIFKLNKNGFTKYFDLGLDPVDKMCAPGGPVELSGIKF